MHHTRTQTESVSHDGILTNTCECIRALYLIEGLMGWLSGDRRHGVLHNGQRNQSRILTSSRIKKKKKNY